jgi:pimeloyl-ACP methyl ester carboxylesterase
MVENIEHFGTKLQVEPFRQLRVFDHGKVGIDEVRARKRIATGASGVAGAGYDRIGLAAGRQQTMIRITANLDANDFLYAVSASRNYDPSPQLERIKVPVMFVNSADDFINPPELGIAEREIKKVENGKFVLIPISDQTHGHSTHTWAAVWQQYLFEGTAGRCTTLGTRLR